MSTAAPDGSTGTAGTGGHASHPSPVVIALAWLVVAVPLGYGLEQTIVKAAKLFTG
ncbi:MFS transporter small subunit [Angustibacter aerolatus]